MAYLLDTNVLSELVKQRPNAGVVEWIASQSSVDLFASVLTLGEIWKGIALMPDGRRREELRTWAAHDFKRMFFGRLLSIDATVTEAWGRIEGDARRAGRPLGVIDALLIATAEVHGLSLVTRNERECAERGVPVVNPWR